MRGVEEAEGDLVVTDCALSALRIQKENRVAVQHPVEALMSAYGLAAADAGDPVGAPRISQATAGAGREGREGNEEEATS